MKRLAGVAPAVLVMALVMGRSSGSDKKVSKTNWEHGGISRKDAAAFTHIAMNKLVSELKAGARSDVK